MLSYHVGVHSFRMWMFSFSTRVLSICIKLTS